MKKLVVLLLTLGALQSYAQKSIADLMNDQTRLYGVVSSAGGVNLVSYGLGIQFVKTAKESNYHHIIDVNLGYGTIGNRRSDEILSYSSQSISLGGGVGLRTGVLEIKLPIAVYLPVGQHSFYLKANNFGDEPNIKSGPILNWGLDVGLHLSKSIRLGFLMGFPVNEPVNDDYNTFGVSLTGFITK